MPVQAAHRNPEQSRGRLDPYPARSVHKSRSPHRAPLCPRPATSHRRSPRPRAPACPLCLSRRPGSPRSSTHPRQSGNPRDHRSAQPSLLPPHKFHRRDALWQVEKAVRKTGPLLDGIIELDEASPLRPMNVEERLIADYHGTGLTTGHHPMAYRRDVLRARGVKSAIELRNLAHGQGSHHGRMRHHPPAPRHRQGNHLHDPRRRNRYIPRHYQSRILHQNRMVVLNERFVLVSGIVQNQDNIVHLKARSIQPLSISAAPTPSHDFH